jgi:hypothetical protein
MSQTHTEIRRQYLETKMKVQCAYAESMAYSTDDCRRDASCSPDIHRLLLQMRFGAETKCRLARYKHDFFKNEK